MKVKRKVAALLALAMVVTGQPSGSNGTAVMGIGRRNAWEQRRTQYGSSGDRVDRQ